jgi:predicted DNA-binding transcriptional regulator YafY
MLSLLQTRRDWPGHTLADRLGTSARTVRRDIDRLRELGYAIRAVKGPDGGYRLEPGSVVPPLLFDDDQVLALAVALRSATAAGAGVEESALRALGAVRQVLPDRLRHRLDALEFTAMPPSSPTADPSTLVAISEAIRAREILRFDYGEVADARPPRRAEPHHLVATGGRWYLVAWDADHEDWRIFRADRVRPKSARGARFAGREVPGGDVRAFVSARFKGAQTDAWPCRGSVVLDLPATRVAPFVGDGVVEELAPGRCRVELGSWSWVALAASFARFDAELGDVHPHELRAAFSTLAARLASAAG